MPFVRKYNINTAEMEKDVSQYNTFNEFFTRKLKPEARQVERNPNILISPCDGRLSVYTIENDTIIPVKGKAYTIRQLVNDDVADEFLNGVCLIFRLAPCDYHRFCYIDDCMQSRITEVDGYLYSVNPIALSSGISIFPQNERQYCTLNTENFGKVLEIDVGATMIGKIIQNNMGERVCKRGEEKGWFEFGGSTVILMLKPNTVLIDEDILKCSKMGIEALVLSGSRIGIRSAVVDTLQNISKARACEKLCSPSGGKCENPI